MPIAMTFSGTVKTGILRYKDLLTNKSMIRQVELFIYQADSVELLLSNFQKIDLLQNAGL